MILFVGHFCGCAFNIMAYIEKTHCNIEYTWLSTINSEHTWFDDYISSFYWAVITMITVGYGNINFIEPNN